MSDINVVKQTWSLDANDDYYLKWPLPQAGSRPYSLILHLIDVSSGDGTITVKARPAGTSIAPVAIPYTSLHLNGSAGTGAQVSTGITGTTLLRVDADGLEIVLTQASRTTGSMTLTMTFADAA